MVWVKGGFHVVGRLYRITICQIEWDFGMIVVAGGPETCPNRVHFPKLSMST